MKNEGREIVAHFSFSVAQHMVLAVPCRLSPVACLFGSIRCECVLASLSDRVTCSWHRGSSLHGSKLGVHDRFAAADLTSCFEDRFVGF